MKKTVAFEKNAANLFFHILTDCNLSCRRCYINRDQHGKDTLPIGVIESWLETFAARAQNANVIFLGGEPTLHPDLHLAVKKARGLGFDSVTIDTNGYLFHDILSKIQPGEADFISFSLDGASEKTNDRLRGKGSFEKCVAGIKKAVSKGFSTSLIYTVGAENIHELERMPKLAANLGIEKFFIQFLGVRGRASSGKGADRQVSWRQWQDAAPKAAAESARLGIPACYPKVFLDPGEVFECAGRVAENYFVFPNKRVYRCPLCEDFPIHAMEFDGNDLKARPPVHEGDLFLLDIPEGCVMNKIISPENLEYDRDGAPLRRVACCMLKEEVF